MRACTGRPSGSPLDGMGTLRLIRLAGIPGHQQNRQRAHALRPQDKHALDVGRRRGPRMKNGVAPLPELRPGIGAVDIDHDIGRIEQNDQVLREIGQCIHLQVLVRQQHRSGFGDAAGVHNQLIERHVTANTIPRRNAPRTKETFAPVTERQAHSLWELVRDPVRRRLCSDVLALSPHLIESHGRLICLLSHSIKLEGSLGSLWLKPGEAREA